jgi:hypothetical protein
MTEIYSSDFADLTGWTLNQDGGTVTQVTQDSRSCVKLLKVNANTAYVSLHRDTGTFSGTVRKFTFVQNLNGLTAHSQNNSCHIVFGLGTNMLALIFASDGLYDSNWVNLCSITQGQWQTIDLYIDFTTAATPKMSRVVVDGTTVYASNGTLPLIVSTIIDGTLFLQVYGYSATPTAYFDSVAITDDTAYAIYGTLKEKESDAAGSAEHYLIINPATGAVLVAGTAGADGAFETSSGNNTTEYALIMPDKDGGYLPTCLNHYITGVSP